MSKYDYLKKYDVHKYEKLEIYDNWFAHIDPNEIRQIEKEMGFSFPSELKEFYEEIGFGMLRSPHIRPEDYNLTMDNEILPPRVAYEFMRGNIALENINYYMADYAYEMLEPGDLPFFHSSDSSSFMVMKLLSNNPNAIWSLTGVPIEDSFEKFIWRLYYENPAYYDDVIQEYRKQNPIIIVEDTSNKIPQFDRVVDRLNYWYEHEQDKAVQFFLKALSRQDELDELKNDLDKIPIHALQSLVTKVLEKSKFHEQTCNELLKLKWHQ